MSQYRNAMPPPANPPAVRVGKRRSEMPLRSDVQQGVESVINGSAGTAPSPPKPMRSDVLAGVEATINGNAAVAVPQPRPLRTDVQEGIDAVINQSSGHVLSAYAPATAGNNYRADVLAGMESTINGTLGDAIPRKVVGFKTNALEPDKISRIYNFDPKPDPNSVINLADQLPPAPQSPPSLPPPLPSLPTTPQVSPSIPNIQNNSVVTRPSFSSDSVLGTHGQASDVAPPPQAPAPIDMESQITSLINARDFQNNSGKTPVYRQASKDYVPPANEQEEIMGLALNDVKTILPELKKQNPQADETDLVAAIIQHTATEYMNNTGGRSPYARRIFDELQSQRENKWVYDKKLDQLILTPTSELERQRRNVQAGGAQVLSGIAGAGRMVTPSGSNARQRFDAIASDLNGSLQYETPESRKYGDNFFGALLDRASQTAPYMASLMAVGALSPAALYASTVAIMGGEAFNNAKQRGLSDDKARIAGAVVGLVGGAIETGATLFQLKLVAGKGAFANSLFNRWADWSEKNVGRSLSSGALSEMMQETSEDLLQEGTITYLGAKPTPEFWKQLADTALTSFLIGGLSGGGGRALRGAPEQQAAPVPPPQQQPVIEQTITPQIQNIPLTPSQSLPQDENRAVSEQAKQGSSTAVEARPEQVATIAPIPEQAPPQPATTPVVPQTPVESTPAAPVAQPSQSQIRISNAKNMASILRAIVDRQEKTKKAKETPSAQSPFDIASDNIKKQQSSTPIQDINNGDIPATSPVLSTDKVNDMGGATRVETKIPNKMSLPQEVAQQISAGYSSGDVAKNPHAISSHMSDAYLLGAYLKNNPADGAIRKSKGYTWTVGDKVLRVEGNSVVEATPTEAITGQPIETKKQRQRKNAQIIVDKQNKIKEGKTKPAVYQEVQRQMELDRLRSTRGNWIDAGNRVNEEKEKFPEYFPQLGESRDFGKGNVQTGGRTNMGKPPALAGATPEAIKKISKRAETPPDAMIDAAQLPKVGKKLLTQFAKEVAEVAIDPAFMVTKDTDGETMLTFTDGYKFEFPATDFMSETDVALLKTGQKIGFDLEQLGLNRDKQIALAKQQASISNNENIDKTDSAIKKAAERPKLEELASGMVSPLSPRETARRAEGIPDAIKAPDADVESRLSAAQGQQRPSLTSKVKDLATRVWHSATRVHAAVPNTEQFDTARELFRNYQEVRPNALNRVATTVAAITDELNNTDYQLFSRHAVVSNQLESLKNGEPLRFGFKSQEQVESYLDQLRKVVDKIPAVKQAIETRNAIVKEITDKLVDSGLLSEEQIGDRQNYFHQQVLSYQQSKEWAARRGARTAKRAFQKARTTGIEELGAEYDYNTDYVEAEASWMADALVELGKKEWLNKLLKKYDATDSVNAEAESSGKSIETIAADKGFVEWQPKPGNAFYPAMSITEKVLEQLQSGILDASELTADDFRKVLAVGGKLPHATIPAEVAKQLDAMAKSEPSNEVIELSGDIIKAWKVWTLFWPKRVVGYFARNATGDVDPVVGGAPGALLKVPQALKELTAYFKDPFAISDSIKEAMPYGVITSGITAQEVPDLRDLAIFERFYNTPKSKWLSLPQNYFDTVKKYNNFREAIMRLAAFSYYKEQLLAGTLKHYGGSKPTMVKSIQKDLGVNAAAAHLSRNLLGDYGNITQLGQVLRKHIIPFYSWMEINSRRTPMLVANAFRAGQAGRGVAAGALYTTAMTLQLGAMYALYAVWNRLMFGDEEDKLSSYERANPHIILGKNDDGSIMIFRNVGAIGDTMEWLGLNDLISMYPKFQAGQLTLGDMAKEMAKSPLNKAVGGLRPDVKGLFEIAAGQSFFPDVTSPRAVPRDILAAQMWGLADEYKAVKGRLLGSGERGSAHWLQRIVGVSDPQDNALNEMYDLRDRYLKKAGKERPPHMGLSKFRHIKNAAKINDYGAFKEALKSYYADGNGAKNWKASLQYLDPVSSRLKDEDEKKFVQFLTPIQRQKLKVAQDYAAVLKTRLQQWHIKAAREGVIPRGGAGQQGGPLLLGR